MFKKKIKKMVMVYFIVALLVNTIMPATVVEAAKVGNKKYSTEMFTKAEIFELANKFEEMKDAGKKTTIPVSILCAICGVGVAGAIYSGGVTILDEPYRQEYKFYREIKDEMILGDYDYVYIKNTFEYSVYKVRNEPFYDWKLIDKKVISYK